MQVVVRIKTKYALPVWKMGVEAVALNYRLWRHTFWEVWEPLPLDQKFAWLLFVNQTIGLLTLIELLVLKKR